MRSFLPFSVGKSSWCVSTKALLALVFFASSAVFGSDYPAVLVEHAPQINGIVEGDLQINTGESVYLNSGGEIHGSLMVPGTPIVHNSIGELPVSYGSGSEEPTSYSIYLNNGFVLSELQQQTDSLPMREALTPLNPEGTRSVVLDSEDDDVGDFSTVRNLSVNGSIGSLQVPEGSYGNFICNAETVLVLGSSDSAEVSVYYFENLILNPVSQIEVVGPVALVIGQGLNLNSGVVGNSEHPEWLTLHLPNSGLNLGSGVSVFGHVIAPNGTVNVNDSSSITGSIQCAWLSINGGGQVIGADSGSPVINEPPVAYGQFLTLNEDEALAFILEAYDPEGASLGYVLDNDPFHGELSGVFPELTYAPDADFFGEDEFRFHVNDGNSPSETVSVHFTVLPVNDAPHVSDLSYLIIEDTNLSFILEGADVDGDNLQFEIIGEPLLGAVTETEEGYLFSPGENVNGVENLQYRAFDGNEWSALAALVIEVESINDAPWLLTQGITIDEDQSVEVMLEYGDDDGDVLELYIVSEPVNGLLTLSEDGLVSYTPNPNYNGTDLFTIGVSDGELSSEAVYDVSVTPVNDVPQVYTLSLVTDEDTNLNFTFEGTDVDGDTLVFEIIGELSLGLITEDADGFLYSPKEDLNGAENLEYRAYDGFAWSETAPLEINILPVNDAPWLDAQDIVTDEDILVEVALEYGDVDGDTVVFSVTAEPSSGAVLVSDDGILTYAPSKDFFGTDSFVITVSDGELENSQAYSVVVNPINDLPEGGDLLLSLEEDGTLAVFFDARDVDSETLWIEILSLPENGVIAVDGVALEEVPTLFLSDADWEYISNADATGTDRFSYRIYDGESYSEAYSAQIDVTPVNDPPVVEAVSLQLTENESLDFVLSGTDAEGDDLEFFVIGVPEYGTISGSSPNFTYSPFTDVIGVEELQYQAYDGADWSESVSLTITIIEDDDPGPGPPSGGSKIGYDAAGRVIWRVQPYGQATTFSYDANGNLSAIGWIEAGEDFDEDGIPDSLLIGYSASDSSLASDESSGDSATSDGGDVSELAFAMSASVSSETSIAQVKMKSAKKSQRYFYLTYQRPIGSTQHYQYVPQVSTSPAGPWSSDPENVEEVSVTPLENGNEEVLVKATSPISLRNRIFIRIQILSL